MGILFFIFYLLALGRMSKQPPPSQGVHAQYYQRSQANEVLDDVANSINGIFSPKVKTAHAVQNADGTLTQTSVTYHAAPGPFGANTVLAGHVLSKICNCVQCGSPNQFAPDATKAVQVACWKCTYVNSFR